MTAEDVRAAQTGWPEAEPDRSVWRILSCAGPAALSNGQIHAALPAFSLTEIAAARERVAGMIRATEPAAPSSLEELLAEPSVTLEEAIACGLMMEGTRAMRYPRRMDSRIIEWDGRHVPEELRGLPPGRYVLEPLSAPLTVQEEQGIRDALEDLDAGRGIPFDDVMNELEGDVEKR